MSMFGNRVKELRKKFGMTLNQVAKKIGSHKGYISGIENGKVNPPSPKMVIKYAKLFDQDQKELLLMAWVDKAHSLIKSDLINKLFHKKDKSCRKEKEDRVSSTMVNEKDNNEILVSGTSQEVSADVPADVPTEVPSNETLKTDISTE